MSSLALGSQQNPGSTHLFGVGPVRSQESDVLLIGGSFQGFTHASAPTTNYLSAQSRGNFFSVSATAAGTYRVKVDLQSWLTSYSSMFPQLTSTQLGGAPGWPDGMFLEAQAWVTNEAAATQPVSGGFLQVNTSKVDINTANVATTYKEFNVYVTQATFSASGFTGLPALTDLTTGDRVNFLLYAKLTGFTP